MFENVTTENYANFMKEKTTSVQEEEKIPTKRNPNRPTARHIIIKMTKFRLPAKLEAKVDTLCLLTQSKEGQQQFKNKKKARTDRKSNCMEVQQPRI